MNFHIQYEEQALHSKTACQVLDNLKQAGFSKPNKILESCIWVDGSQRVQTLTAGCAANSMAIYEDGCRKWNCNARGPYWK